MKISLYTSVRNGLFLDYHVIEMLRHHLPLVDEIIVNDGFSTDGTYDEIIKIDPKIKAFRSDWGTPSGQEWFSTFKEESKTLYGRLVYFARSGRIHSRMGIR